MLHLLCSAIGGLSDAVEKWGLNGASFLSSLLLAPKCRSAATLGDSDASTCRPDGSIGIKQRGDGEGVKWDSTEREILHILEACSGFWGFRSVFPISEQSQCCFSCTIPLAKWCVENPFQSVWEESDC